MFERMQTETGHPEGRTLPVFHERFSSKFTSPYLLRNDVAGSYQRFSFAFGKMLSLA